MQTPKEYLNKNKKIIPCKGKLPTEKGWQKRDFDLEDFKPGSNIGLKLVDDVDIDVETNKSLPFINRYIQPCSAIYGRGNRPRSHLLFKGKSKHKKFSFHKDLEMYYKDLPHGATIIECRHGEDKQSIVPGSIIDGDEVKWCIYEGISPYPGNILEDVSKVALATALSILYPSKGDRDDFCYAVACILAKNTEWKDFEIDEFIMLLAESSGDDDLRKNKGTHAHKQIINGGKIKGFNTIREILGLDNAESIYQMFQWVGVNPPDRRLEELKEKMIFIQDSSSMYDVNEKIEFKKEDFNNRHLYNFPGGKNKKKAFESLLTDYEFQDRIVIGRAVLPGYDYPIAEVGRDHFYLKPGKYLNLYPGAPIEPEKGDVSDWVNSYKQIFGERDYDYIEQYLSAFIQKIFKHKLDITEEHNREIGPMKIQWGILIVGPEGTGKKGLGETLQRIVGREFVDANARYDELIGNHSEVIYNKLFIFINEVVTTGQIDKKVEISNRLKPFWTDEDSKINPKHIRPFRYWNNCNGMCFSNEQDCLHIGKSSRRYLVINLYDRLNVAKLQEHEELGTFEKIYNFIQSDKIKNLFHYFLYEVEVKDWKIFNRGRAPTTDALINMQEEAQHPIIQRLNRALEEGLTPFDITFPGFVVLDDLLDYIRVEWKLQVNEKYVKDWLREKSFKWNNGKQTRQLLSPYGGQRPRAWLLKDCKYLRSLTETELGSAPGMTTYDYEFKRMKYSLKHEQQLNNTFEQQRIKYLRVVLKWLLGTRWDKHSIIRFFEECCLAFYKGSKETKDWVKRHQSGASGQYDIEDAIKDREELRNTIEKEKRKWIIGLFDEER